MVQTYLLILVRSGVVLLGTVYVEQYVGKSFYGIHISAHHEVRESHIIIKSDVASCNTGIKALSIQINWLKCLQGQIIVPKEALNTELPNYTKIA